jgi:MFS-type transporter involved in bile tolerance (Atg22 family)
MDTAPRSAFLAAVLKPTERTAIMGFFTIIKTASGSLAPTITGLLAKNNFFWIAFVVAGSLKALYDIGILLVFATKEKESREDESRGDSEHS